MSISISVSYINNETTHYEFIIWPLNCGYHEEVVQMNVTAVTALNIPVQSDIRKEIFTIQRFCQLQEITWTVAKIVAKVTGNAWK